MPFREDINKIDSLSRQVTELEQLRTKDRRERDELKAEKDKLKEELEMVRAQVEGLSATLDETQQTNDALFLTLGRILYVSQKKWNKHTYQGRTILAKADERPIRIIKKYWQEDSMNMMERKYRDSMKSKEWGPTE